MMSNTEQILHEAEKLAYENLERKILNNSRPFSPPEFGTMKIRKAAKNRLINVFGYNGA